MHILVWVTYATTNFAIYQVQGVSNNIIDYTTKYLLGIVLFYVNILFIFPNSFEKKKYFLFSLFLLATLFLNFVVRYMAYLYILPLLFHYQSKNLSSLSAFQYFIVTIWWWYQFTIYSAGYSYAKKAIEKEKSLRILEHEKQQQKEINLQLEQQKLQIENAFLRSQINPHTLHNILNMLYSKSIRADAPELSEAILILSNLMRYSLESATDANGFVPLEKELEQINNTIKINQLRASNKFNIDFKVAGDADQAKIIPLMLITLVENAFKYAELNDEAYPLLLHITLDKNSFVFYMHNKKRTVIVHETSHGIGLENTRQRLKAAYGEDGYNIDIRQDDNFYTFKLTIYQLTRKSQPVNNPGENELASP
jgi:two-component system, LytTR family, sensor kinase